MTDLTSNISAGDSASRRVHSTIEFQDSALVERCRKGDMQAFGLLVAKYQDRVLNLILRLCGNVSDAEELAQETFLKVLEKIGQFRGQSNFYTWLFRIAANMAISHRRRSGRIRFSSLWSGSEDDAPAGGPADLRQPSPAALAESAETGLAVMRALEELDEASRVVIVLRDVEDMDYSQIAEVLELPIGTVKSRIYRARCMLKERLTGLA